MVRNSTNGSVNSGWQNPKCKCVIKSKDISLKHEFPSYSRHLYLLGFVHQTNTIDLRWS